MSKEDADKPVSEPARSPHRGAHGEVCFNLSALISHLKATEDEEPALMREKSKLEHLMQNDDGVDKLFNHSLKHFRILMKFHQVFKILY